MKIYPAPSSLKSRSQRQCIVVLFNPLTRETFTSVCFGSHKRLLRDYSRLFPDHVVCVYALSGAYKPLYNYGKI